MDSAGSNDSAQGLPGLVWAFCFDLHGGVQELPVDHALAKPAEGWLWLHFDVSDARAAESIRRACDLPNTALEILLSDDERQQLHTEEGCVYGIFAGLVVDSTNVERDIGFLHFAMTEKCLVSSHRSALSAVDETRLFLSGDRKITRVGTLLELIVEKIVDAIDDFAAELAVKLDDVEEKILADEATDELNILSNIRRVTVRLHRQIAISQLLIHRFERDISPNAPAALRISTKKLAQHIEWLDGQIVSMREKAHLLQEEVMMRTADETNRHLQVLAIVATIFLPATLIAGIFGMNVKGLPLTDNPWGFVWSIVLLFATSAVVVWLLKRSGILK